MPVPRPPLPRPGAEPGRRRVLAALLGAPLLGLTACSDRSAGPAEDGPVELSVFWYGDEGRAAITEKALRLYSERNPRVTFRVTWQGAAGYHDRLATQAAGGNVPDLIQLDDSVLTEYALRDIVLDLSRHVADNRLDLRTLPDGLVRYGQVDGRTVGVAAGQTAAAVVFNRTLLRRLDLPAPTTGMTWSEYVEWARRVTRAGGGRVAGTMDPSGDYRALWLWLRGRGSEFYQGRGLAFDRERLLQWFDLWQEARRRRATPSAALIEQADSGDATRQLVVTGAAAASFAWAHQLPTLQSLTEDELDLAGVPGPPAAQWARASMYWTVFRGTRHPDVAVDVINFLTSNGEAGVILGHERGVNPSLAVRRYTEGSIGDPAQQRAAVLGNALANQLGPAPAPPPRGHSEVRNLLLAAAESVRSGDVGTRAAVDRFLGRAEAALTA
ncbi:ABC transporter substrate-binding protein [Micromonospora endolithica]|uniref:Extracellular solute-binding protein n=1 Tax=Micromonospora endolithica TaxID=230091 RepID=A0A3A9YVX8_9ACTN|nr:extracellular solute-binding protein [Micromonospora endolithica]RKN39919.1 extracellular solute-binding protein [Micromonospora endolithica]TWJ26073.1 carbohydrate ABC transporter substrate-binding protein, CUT1 family (TC 3.A.1.1.-) [Micromonospora endolithica]